MATIPSPPRTLRARLWRAVGKVSLGLMLLVLVAGGLGYRWLTLNVLSTLPADLSGMRDFRPLTSCQIYAEDSSLVDEFYLERRIWVPLDELPEHVWRAFVLAEDRRFFEHEGVDFPGIARALWVNLSAGSAQQGGSTLTQQLIKNLIVGKERSYRRKLKEAVLAWRLENELSKQEILELYLNYVALGSGNYGVEAAARDYFGISARNIDPGQAALLAGLVPAPSRYSPRSNPVFAAERREIVLRLMVRGGALSPELAVLANQAPVLTPREAAAQDRPALAYVTEVRREVRGLLGNELPFSLGLQVHTALDLPLQAVATAAVREALEAHLQREGIIGPARRLRPETWATFLDQAAGIEEDPRTGELREPKAGQCFDVLVGESRDLGSLRAGPWTYALAAEQRTTLVRSDVPDEPPTPLDQKVEMGDLLRVCAAGPGEVRLADRPWAEGAAVVLENRTGRIKALVGGYQETLEGFVRATQAKRQPGSSFKPYLYAAALLRGRTQLDTVIDGPIALPAGGGQLWAPKNYEESYAGRVLLRKALAKSMNTVAVRLILETGAAEVSRVAAAMGVRTPLRKDLTIALGTSELTPMDHALGYSTIVRGGVTTDPVFIDRLNDVNGALLGTAGGHLAVEGMENVRLPGGPGERALPPGVASELTDMMREVVAGGTGRKAYDPRHDRAGKTGTTNSYQDAWFAGFTPDYTVVVWVGTDGTRTLGEAETGARAALPAWLRIVSALPDDSGRRFVLPPEAKLVPLGKDWVVLPRGAKVAGVGPEPLAAFGR